MAAVWIMADRMVRVASGTVRWTSGDGGAPRSLRIRVPASGESKTKGMKDIM